MLSSNCQHGQLKMRIRNGNTVAEYEKAKQQVLVNSIPSCFRALLILISPFMLCFAFFWGSTVFNIFWHQIRWERVKPDSYSATIYEATSDRGWEIEIQGDPIDFMFNSAYRCSLNLECYLSCSNLYDETYAYLENTCTVTASWLSIRDFEVHSNELDTSN